MAAFERQVGDVVHLWVVEQRGAVLWFREGKSGNNGRMSHRPYRSEEAARAAMGVECSRRIAAGFVLIDEARTVSAPLLSRAALQRPRPERLTVSTLNKRLAAAVAGGRERTLDELANAFLTAVALPCDWRLSSLACSCSDDGRHIELTASYRRGSGENPDDFEFDPVRLRAELSLNGSMGLEDEVTLDAFADELLSWPAPRMTARFARALDDLELFARHRSARVLRAEVEGAA